MANYNRPKNIKYTDMCIFIDDYINNGVYNDEDDEKVFIYICTIVHMFSYKYKFFKFKHDYENFAEYAASIMYMRLKNENLDKVKSVLNYIKASIYGWKVQYQQKFFAQTNMELEESLDVEKFGYIIDESYKDIDLIETEVALEQIIDSIKSYLKRIPYTGVEKYNIYLSVLLTFLDTITLDNKSIARLKSMQDTRIDEYRTSVAMKIYSDMSNNTPILYHLDDSMSNYIATLTKEVKHLIASDISYTSKYNVSANDAQALMMLNNIGEKNE